MKERARRSIDFKPEEVKRDAEKFYYNGVLVGITDEVVERMPGVLSHPAFDKSNASYLQKLF